MFFKNREQVLEKHQRDHRPRRDTAVSLDDTVKEAIEQAQDFMTENMKPAQIKDLNSFQRKQLRSYYERLGEFEVRSYKDDEEVIIRVYPVGMLKRLAEQKMQEVLMNGKLEPLPPMSSFERFIIHDYLKERDGIRTESSGEGTERHIIIHPLFGRQPRKAKRRLTR
ncbi:hypothetical protein BVY01_02130 [bacterium I07]|nr:hypothetical protein BVY01_02130 [bacterium I07]